MTTIQVQTGGDHYATSYNGSGSGITGITRSGLSTGTANFVVINNGAGVMSEEAQLAVSRGGTGQNFSGVVTASIVVITSGVATATLGYGTASAANTLVQRDGSGNVAVGQISTTTITSASNITLTPTGGNIYTGTSLVHATPTGIAGSDTFVAVGSVQTVNAVTNVLYALTTASGTAGTAYTIRGMVACGEVGGRTGMFTFVIKAKNLLTVLTTSAVLSKNLALDNGLDNPSAIDITATVAAQILNINVVGKATYTVNWVGKFEITSQTF